AGDGPFGVGLFPGRLPRSSDGILFAAGRARGRFFVRFPRRAPRVSRASLHSASVLKRWSRCSSFAWFGNRQNKAVLAVLRLMSSLYLAGCPIGRWNGHVRSGKLF